MVAGVLVASWAEFRGNLIDFVMICPRLKIAYAIYDLGLVIHFPSLPCLVRSGLTTPGIIILLSAECIVNDCTAETERN